MKVHTTKVFKTFVVFCVFKNTFARNLLFINQKAKQNNGFKTLQVDIFSNEDKIKLFGGLQNEKNYKRAFIP